MIVIDVTARVSKLEGPIKRASSLVEKMEKSIDRATKAMEKFAAAAGSANQALPSTGGGGGGNGGRRTPSGGWTAPWAKAGAGPAQKLFIARQGYDWAM